MVGSLPAENDPAPDETVQPPVEALVSLNDPGAGVPLPEVLPGGVGTRSVMVVPHDRVHIGVFVLKSDRVPDFMADDGQQVDTAVQRGVAAHVPAKLGRGGIEQDHRPTRMADDHPLEVGKRHRYLVQGHEPRVLPAPTPPPRMLSRRRWR